VSSSAVTVEPLILGIETSCDETGVGIVRGQTLLADAIASSVEEHARFGGVVPEVASRAHLEAMVPTIRRACETAGIKPTDVDAVAVTSGPGLAGALLVGVAAAKGLALSLDKYEQDQVVQLFEDQANGQESAGLVIADRPDRSIKLDIDEEPKLLAMLEKERQALLKKRVEEGYGGRQRIFLGKQRDRSTSLVMRDQQGRPRIVMQVDAQGTPSLEFLDEEGQKVASYGSGQ